MNKLILALFVVVCVVAVNAKDLNAQEALYDTYDDQVGLDFPSGCRRRTLVKYARDCKLLIQRRWNGYRVRDPADKSHILVIPWIVRQNTNCRVIINTLKGRCEGSTTSAPTSTTDTAAYYGESDYYK